MKKCAKCNNEKSLTEFYKNKMMSDGRSSWCKTCSSEYLRQYRLTNHEYWKEYGRKYRFSPSL